MPKGWAMDHEMERVMDRVMERGRPGRQSMRA